MKTVVVKYRFEADGAWIATAPSVPGFYAYGDSYEEAKARVDAGLPDFVGEDDVHIAHWIAGDEAGADATTRSPKVTFGSTKTSQPQPSYRHEIFVPDPA